MFPLERPESDPRGGAAGPEAIARFIQPWGWSRLNAGNRAPENSKSLFRGSWPTRRGFSAPPFAPLGSDGFTEFPEYHCYTRTFRPTHPLWHASDPPGAIRPERTALNAPPPSLAQSRPVSPSLAQSRRVLIKTPGLHGFTWFYMVLRGFTRFYMVLHGFTWFYRVAQLKPGVLMKTQVLIKTRVLIQTQVLIKTRVLN